MSSRRSLRTALWRAAYKSAWAARKVIWYAPWPHLNGALVAVWSGDRVLMVRNSYNDYFTFPGGRLNWGETYRAAAVRELWEETGIVVDAAEIERVLAERMGRPFGPARVEIFRWSAPELPEVKLDPVEIAEYRWCTRDEAATLPLFRPVARCLKITDVDMV